MTLLSRLLSIHCCICHFMNIACSLSARISQTFVKKPPHLRQKTSTSPVTRRMQGQVSQQQLRTAQLPRGRAKHHGLVMVVVVVVMVVVVVAVTAAVAMADAPCCL